ncbi:DUF2268 domain-containing protein [Lederbergia citrea]|uniref:DUF2268 domain-containing protein n=2 Tax=Lederbergia citrea TaxID=2833581 RepID=A0A942UH33_9BACI|nr:DUF2268 domain-containing putative Zn-dependent protease [Lederbergia citrea]MBS4221331.1 hypothetical protein [Lederbergia citrea]
MANPDVKDGNDFYRYLTQFGMYRPSREALRSVGKLEEEKVWEKIENIYTKYRKKWRGPDVDIYIFPINQSNRMFIQQLKGRSGLAFPHKLFLFISDGLDDKNLEALVVHEYHHAARMNNYKKNNNDYTLLDSLLFEGLAEHAVLKCCGVAYTAEWTKQYSPDRLKYYWNHSYEQNLQITRENRLHDDLLFGRRRVPKMMGYSMGYELAKGYIKNNQLTIIDSLKIPSEKLLVNNKFISE